jgi:hypothetical protein
MWIKGTIVLRILVPIAVLIIVIPILWNSVSNLQQLDQEKENAKQIWIPHFQYVIQTCVNATGITLDNCKQSINLEMQSCSFYDNPSVCNDPRINQIMTSTAQTVIVPPSTNFVTYTNNQFGFSIDYPSNWVIDNSLPDGNIGLKDKMVAPNFLVEIKPMQNTGSSFDQLVSSYLSQAGVAGYPITVQSQDKITIGNKEAYRIQYAEPIGSTTCNNEDYIISDGQVVPVISFNNCDENLYASFLPTFDKMVSTFR